MILLSESNELKLLGVIYSITEKTFFKLFLTKHEKGLMYSQ